MTNHGLLTATALPNGRRPGAEVAAGGDSPSQLRARIQELETLCAEVYLAAVELGLPQPLLNRLWTVAAHGASPSAFGVDMPAPVADAPAHPMPLPDIRLTDRSNGKETPTAQVPQPELQPLPTRRRVMVVDDDPMMLEVLQRIMQRENYELHTASSGPDALNATAGFDEAIDLLITDYAMPHMHGRELAERMRERYPQLRVLYQTGFSDMLFQDRVELEDQSAFLEKPFTARGLREAARLILFGEINPAA